MLKRFFGGGRERHFAAVVDVTETVEDEALICMTDTMAVDRDGKPFTSKKKALEFAKGEVHSGQVIIGVTELKDKKAGASK